MITKQLIKGLLIANWYWIALAIIAACFFLYIVSYVDSCNSKKFEKKTNEQKQQINEGKGEVKQIEEQRNATKNEVNQAESNSAIAANAVNSVVNTDSGARNSSREAAIREWCKDHAGDSKCIRFR